MDPEVLKLPLCTSFCSDGLDILYILLLVTVLGKLQTLVRNLKAQHQYT